MMFCAIVLLTQPIRGISRREIMTEKMGRAGPGAQTLAVAVRGKVVDHHTTGRRSLN